MTEPSDELRAQLEALASTLDDQAPTLPVQPPARSAPRARGHVRQRVLLVAAAAIVAVIAGAVAFTSANGDDRERTQVLTPGPDTSSSTSTTPAGESTVDWISLPNTGLAVQSDTGRAEIFDLNGTLLGTTPAPTSGGDLRPNGALVFGNGLSPDLQSAVEVPDGCDAARVGGGHRVALCGEGSTGPSRIELVDIAGERTVLVDGSLDANSGLGHWRWAIPSPDGEWVLAQWSGECEAPRAHLISTSTGASRPVGGTNPDPSNVPLTEGLGWTPDGRMVVQFVSGGCGPDIPDPGTYLVETTTLAKTLVLDQTGDGSGLVYMWRGQPPGNRLEALIDQAADVMPYEPCCGEPSHGGPGVTTGWFYDGYNISVVGFPTASSADLYPGMTVQQRMPLAHGEAAILGAPQGPTQPASAVAFTCGANTWVVSWVETGTPEVDSMLLLAEEILPHLGCTLQEPPGPQSS